MFTRRSAHHSPHRSIFLIGIAILFVSLVTPMVSPRANAAMLDDADPCQAGFVVNEDTGGCEQAQPPSDRQPLLQPTIPDRLVRPTTPPEPTDVPVRPTAIPTEPPVECEPGFVLNPFTGACDPIRPTNVPVEATEVVVEPTEISVEPTQVIEPTRESEQSEPVDGSQEPDEPIEPEDGGATAEFTAWICPEDSALDPTLATPGELAKQCVEPLSGVGLELLSNGEPFTRGETNDQGRLLVGDIPAGELAVIQHAPEGYSFGAVTTTIYPDGPDGEPLPPTIGNEPGEGWTSSIDPDVLVDYNVYYFYWDISITVETYWCPWMDPLLGLSALESACQAYASPDVEIRFTTVNANFAFTVFPAGASGAVYTASNLDPNVGPWIVQEFGVFSSWLAVPYCQESGASSFTHVQPDAEWDGQTGDWHTELELQTQPFNDWQCKWFHVPQDINQQAIVYVLPYVCDTWHQGFVDSSDALASCPNRGLFEGYTLTDVNAVVHPPALANKVGPVDPANTQSNWLAWSYLPHGPLSITQAPPAGLWVDPIVFCTSNDLQVGATEPLPPSVEVPAAGGTIQRALDAQNDYINCRWFHIPSQFQLGPVTTPMAEATIELPETKPPLLIPICDPEQPVIQQAGSAEFCVPGIEGLEGLGSISHIRAFTQPKSTPTPSPTCLGSNRTHRVP